MKSTTVKMGVVGKAASISVAAALTGGFLLGAGVAQAQDAPMPGGTEGEVSAQHTQLAQPQPTQKNKLSKLGACVADKQALDVVLLMDETDSLTSEYVNGQKTDKPGSDADNHRIPAAQAFVDELAAKQQSQGFNARIRIAGFGQQYKSNATMPDQYSDWLNVSEKSADSIKGEIAKFANRTEEMYTNYANAMQGGYEDLLRAQSDSDPCRMLVTFTDGALTAQESEQVARDTLCRPDGVTDRLRNAGITHVGIGLSRPGGRSEFDLIRDITEGGGPCGTAEPNGAFFAAENVGDLFQAFHGALATGGEFGAEHSSNEDFEFWLDDSITKIRFMTLAKAPLPAGATVHIEGPNGKSIDLVDKGTGSLSGADVSWVSMTSPLNRTSGTLTKSNDSWAGQWRISHRMSSADQASVPIYSSVQMQPDLAVVFGVGNADGAGSPQRSGNKDGNGSQVQLRDSETLQLRLVDGAEGKQKTHPVAGSAIGKAVFYRGNSSEGEVLADNIDVSSGVAEVAVNGLGDLPATGRVEVETTVTTQGPGDQPGTTLAPFVNASALSVTPNNLPLLPGEVTFRADTAEFDLELPVSGPGKLWVEEGATLAARTLPEGATQFAVSSEYNSSSNALQLENGQTATMILRLSADAVRDGTVVGDVPISMSSLDGAETAAADIPVNGTTTIPVNKAAFTLVFIAALLLAIAIPLGLLYLIRFLTARIDTKQGFGAQRFAITKNGAMFEYDGRSEPAIRYDDVARNRVTTDGISFSAMGAKARVRRFSLNPFTPSPVVVQTTPSISSRGKQTKNGKAAMNLAVQGDWFLMFNEQSRGIDLIVLPRIPLATEDRAALVRDIHDRVPALYDGLNEQLPKEPIAEDTANAPTDNGGYGFGAGSSQGQDPYGGQNQDPYGSQGQDPYGSQGQDPYGSQGQDPYGQPYGQG